jgi:hypothetical protein
VPDESRAGFELALEPSSVTPTAGRWLSPHDRQLNCRGSNFRLRQWRRNTRWYLVAMRAEVSAGGIGG